MMPQICPAVLPCLPVVLLWRLDAVVSQGASEEETETVVSLDKRRNPMLIIHMQEYPSQSNVNVPAQDLLEQVSLTG